MNDWSTTEDDPCEPETQEVGYPETGDICSDFRYPWSDSRADNLMVSSSLVKPCFQSDMSFPADV